MKNNFFKASFCLALFCGVSALQAQETKTNISKYDYHDAFAQVFILKMEPKLVLQVGNQEQSIGKIELIIS